MNLIIFTDLDATLLNYEDYSFRGALPSLKRIKRLGVPLIITTSKTRREVEFIQKDLEIDEPYIVENGAAIYFPPKYMDFFIENNKQEPPFCITHIIQLGTTYEPIRSFIDEMREKFPIRGFGDMSISEISEITGLSPQRAEFAKEREYSEPFIMERDQDIPLLQRLAVERGIKITKGGRFYHMTGMYQDKGEAVKIVRDIFDRKDGNKHPTIGVGDSLNDLPMLKNVDIPVIVPHPLNSYLDVSLPGLIKASSTGSKGWNDTIWRLLNEFETGDN